MNSDKTTAPLQPPKRELLSMMCCFRLTPEDMEQLDRLGLLCDSDRSKIVRECLATGGRISIIKPLTEAVRTFYTACARAANLCAMVNRHIAWILRNPFLDRELIEELIQTQQHLEDAGNALTEARNQVTRVIESLNERLSPERTISPLLLKRKHEDESNFEKMQYGRLCCRASVRITEIMAKQLIAAAKARSLKRAQVVRSCVITGTIVDVGAELVEPIRSYYRQIEEIGYDVLSVAEELQIIAEDPMTAAEEQDQIRATLGELRIEEQEIELVRAKLTEDLLHFLKALPRSKEEQDGNL